MRMLTKLRDTTVSGYVRDCNITINKQMCIRVPNIVVRMTTGTWSCFFRRPTDSRAATHAMLCLQYTRKRATHEGLKTGAHPDRLPDRTVLVSLPGRPTSTAEEAAAQSCPPPPPLLLLYSPSPELLLLLTLLLLPLRVEIPVEDRRLSLFARDIGGCMVSVWRVALARLPPVKSGLAPLSVRTQLGCCKTCGATNVVVRNLRGGNIADVYPARPPYTVDLFFVFSGGRGLLLAGWSRLSAGLLCPTSGQGGRRYRLNVGAARGAGAVAA